MRLGNNIVDPSIDFPPKGTGMRVAILVLGLFHSQANGASVVQTADAVSYSRPDGFAGIALAQGRRETLVWRTAQDSNAPEQAPTMRKPAPSHAVTATTFNIACQTIQSAARANGLPLEFLTRLIWQESRFRAYAVSPAGAKGVAQFMPETAADVGLGNPFDVSDAINKSAELLRHLKRQFGNFGFAAAAYNAGPKRVQEWIAGHRSLPPETKAYVRIVTGRPASEWALPQARQLSPIFPNAIPCAQLVRFMDGRLESMSIAKTQASNPAPVLSRQIWGVQLLGNASKAAALAAYHQLQRKYRALLELRQPLMIRSKVGRNGYWYRVRIAESSLIDAERFCAHLRAVGGSCLVQRN